MAWSLGHRLVSPRPQIPGDSLEGDVEGAITRHAASVEGRFVAGDGGFRLEAGARNSGRRRAAGVYGTIITAAILIHLH